MTDEDIEWLQRVVKRYVRRLPPGVDRGELLSDAYAAMASLRERFDESLGVPFHGYAYRRVIGAMQDGLRGRRLREQRAGRNEIAIEQLPVSSFDLPLHRLPRIGRLTIQLHYLEQIELQTVAAIFGCTKARISQIHQKALRLLQADSIKQGH